MTGYTGLRAMSGLRKELVNGRSSCAELPGLVYLHGFIVIRNFLFRENVALRPVPTVHLGPSSACGNGHHFLSFHDAWLKINLLKDLLITSRYTELDRNRVGF